jgi:hypothetical protein
MAVVTIRANQNSYTFDQTGGTRDPQAVLQDRVPFMDAIEDQRTEVLDSLSKGAPSNEDRPRWGIHRVTPRASTVGAQLTAGATSVTVPTGHGARFQQGHTLQLTRASDAETEVVWVADDPQGDSLTLVRGIGTTAIQFEVGDKVAVIGIALPQGADFPLAPVSRGEMFYNRWQFFGKSLVHTDEANVIPQLGYDAGTLISRDNLQIGKDIRMDLDRSLLLGRRRAGDPSPAAPRPQFMGGLIQMAELSGNIFTIGGSNVLLSKEAISFVQHDVKAKYSERGGMKWLMSWNTKQIVNRIFQIFTEAQPNGQTFDERWSKYQTEVGLIEFTWDEDFPDGLILGYTPKNVQYHPLTGHDWKEKEFPTKGFYSWNGIGGIYTLKAKDIPGMFLIRGFDTNLAHYPQAVRASTFILS